MPRDSNRAGAGPHRAGGNERQEGELASEAHSRGRLLDGCGRSRAPVPGGRGRSKEGQEEKAGTKGQGRKAVVEEGRDVEVLTEAAGPVVGEAV